MAATLKIPSKLISSKRHINDLEDITNFDSLSKSNEKNIQKNKKMKVSAIRKEVKSVNFKKFTPSTDEEIENENVNDNDNEQNNITANNNKKNKSINDYNSNNNNNNNDKKMFNDNERNIPHFDSEDKNYSSSRNSNIKSPSPCDSSLNIPSPSNILKRRSKSFGSAHGLNANSTNNSVIRDSNNDSAIPSSSMNASSRGNDDDNDLDSNIDYISLSSTLRLLKNQKTSINQQILSLSHYYKECQKNPVEFISKINRREIVLPKQNKIFKSPLINFKHYNFDNDEFINNNFEKGFVKNKPIFKTLNLFSK